MTSSRSLPAGGSTQRLAVGITFTVWVLEASAYIALIAISGRERWISPVLTVIGTVLFALAMSAVLLSVAIRVRAAPAGKRYAVVGLTAVMCTVATVCADLLISSTLNDMFAMGLSFTPDYMLRTALRTAIEISWIFGVLAATYIVLQTQRLVEERERQLEAARMAVSNAAAAAHQAQLAALRFQLNPHFLFNTLNAISSLIVTDRSADAEIMTGKLSAFLRSSLEADPESEVTLDEELETVQSYLEIENVRFGERLTIAFECPTSLLGALVPSFLLQPIVENAIKYAVAPSRRPVVITVRADLYGGKLRLTIEDEGRQAFGTLPKGGTGLGLSNIRQRLRGFYGDAGVMDATATERGFRVTLELPYRQRGEARQAAE